MAFVAQTASYLPEKVVENRDLVQFPEKFRNLIAEKAGIRTRRHVTKECTSDLGARAAQIVLDKAGISPDSVGALICATSSPDRMQPATATRIQELCGMKRAFAFDINSVCSSAVYALRLASALVRDGLSNVVVVASEVYSRILNPADISTYPYFGDGAGAVLVAGSGSFELRDFVLHSDGSGADLIQVRGGGTMLPAPLVESKNDLYFSMLGREVFEFACRRGSELVMMLSQRNDVIPDRVVPHQANINIIREIATRSNLAFSKFFVNLEYTANTAAASVLIAFDELLSSKCSDKNIFLVVFGGGLSWGGAYVSRCERSSA